MAKEISIEEALNNLKRLKRVVIEDTDFISSKVSSKISISSKDSLFSNLINIVSSIGQDKPAKPSPTPEEYIKLWQQYLSGSQLVLPHRAIRYLCWYSEIATSERFIKYIEVNNSTLSPQQLQGLVRSCHDLWTPHLASGYVTKYVSSLIKSYKGANRVIEKWQANLSMILGLKGDSEFGKKIFEEKNLVKAVCEKWFLDQETQYCINAVGHAIKFCEEDLKKGNKQIGDFLIDNLISWEGWLIEGFKKQVESALLNNDITNYSLLKNKLITLILSKAKDKLGDPRLPNNSRKWLGISDVARRRLIQWLSMEDIVFFFEHVLPDSKDKHGRKDFWLKYVNVFQQTRAFLCEEDRLRLASTINRNKDKIENFGKLKGKNSAFLLDFGSVIAVEFSKVGAIYLYNREQFNRIIMDFWSSKEFGEGDFKQMDFNLARIPHTGNWEYPIRAELSRLGIRPS